MLDDKPGAADGARAKRAALELRYGATSLPLSFGETTASSGPWNDTLALLMSHRSVRGFRPDPVPPGTLAMMVAAAQSAATSSNLQTWSVVSVTDPTRRAALAKLANNQKHIEECPLFLVWLADISRNDRLGKAEGKMLEVLPYLETYLVAAIDAALAAQNAVVAAESIGLSTVYIGALRNDPSQVAELLELPPGCMGVFGLCVGYPKDGVANEVKPRLAQQAILHHDRYKVSNEEAALREAYDKELAVYSRRHEMSQYSWTERVLGRMGKISALSGRHTLTATLRKLGFALT
jgi:nitroreductase